MRQPFLRPSRIAAAAAALLLAAAVRASAQDAAKPDQVDFARDIQPILKASCVKCHGLNEKMPRKKPAAGLRLDDEAAAMKGGRSGKAIVPGHADDSLLYKLLKGPVPRPVKGEDDKDIAPMPKAKRGEKWKPLPDDQVALIKKWIDQGAQWSK